MRIIKFYKSGGDSGFLSNLFLVPVVFEGKKFRSSEEAYQYGKPVEKEVAEWVISAPHQRQVAMSAHALLSYDVVPDWENIKVDRMRAVIKAKFSQNPELKKKLLDTGDALLAEDSPVDKFWGIGALGDGKNMLGKLLMELRGEFRKS